MGLDIAISVIQWGVHLHPNKTFYSFSGRAVIVRRWRVCPCPDKNFMVFRWGGICVVVRRGVHSSLTNFVNGVVVVRRWEFIPAPNKKIIAFRQNGRCTEVWEGFTPTPT